MLISDIQNYKSTSNHGSASNRNNKRIKPSKRFAIGPQVMVVGLRGSGICQFEGRSEYIQASGTSAAEAREDGGCHGRGWQIGVY
jgi:hypothetical protein